MAGARIGNRIAFAACRSCVIAAMFDLFGYGWSAGRQNLAASTTWLASDRAGSLRPDSFTTMKGIRSQQRAEHHDPSIRDHLPVLHRRDIGGDADRCLLILL